MVTWFYRPFALVITEVGSMMDQMGKWTWINPCHFWLLFLWPTLFLVWGLALGFFVVSFFFLFFCIMFLVQLWTACVIWKVDMMFFRSVILEVLKLRWKAEKLTWLSCLQLHGICCRNRLIYLSPYTFCPFPLLYVRKTADG